MHERQQLTAPMLQMRNSPGMNPSQTCHRRTRLRTDNGGDSQHIGRHGAGSTPTFPQTKVPVTAPQATNKKMDSGGVSDTGPSAQLPFPAEMAEAIRRLRRPHAGRAVSVDGSTVGAARGVVLPNHQGLGGEKTSGQRARRDRGRTSNRTRTARRRKTTPDRTSSPARPAARSGGRSGAATARADPVAGAGARHGRALASTHAVGRNGSRRHGRSVPGAMHVGIQRRFCNSRRTTRTRSTDIPRPTTACQSGTRT